MPVLPQPVVHSRAVVLRAWPSGETSVVASLLTEARGYVRVIAKGARQGLSRLQPLVGPGRLVEVEFGWSPGRELQYLKGGSLLLDPLLDANSLERTAYALSALEVADRCRPSGVRETGLFGLCRRYLEMLSSCAAGDEAPLFYAFETALLELQGIAPELAACAACGGGLEAPGCRFSPAAGGAVCGACAGADDRPLAPETLAALRSLGGAAPERSSRRTSRETGILLHRFLTYHLPEYRLPASLDLLRAARSADAAAAAAKDDEPC
ncbi:MAG: DNA repair protein RecO [bacterium]|nr:DNA repair protein RecO [bacterium]